MNFLEELLDGAKVEWKTVSEIFHLRNGYTPSKSKEEFWEHGTVAWFRMEDIRQNGRILDESIQKISEGAVKGGKLFPENSIIISTSATIGEHALVTRPYLANQRFTNLNLKEDYAEIFDIKFLFYYCHLLADWCKKNTTMASFASVEMDGFRRFKIPIPCPDNPQKSLHIQAEIVRILDKFTELTTELRLRKKQYQYYRDKLLTFPQDKVAWKSLGELGEFIRGNGLQKKDFLDEGFPAIHYGQVYTRYGLSADKTFTYISPELAQHLKKAQKNDLLFTTTSEDDEGVAKPLAWFGGQAAISGHMMLFRHSQNVKYLAYFFQTENFQKQKSQHITGTKVREISSKNLAKIKIPIPSLAEQARIVGILDKFETLTQSLQEGLPREIELRNKQYHYYRDMLLNFP